MSMFPPAFIPFALVESSELAAVELFQLPQPPKLSACVFDEFSLPPPDLIFISAFSARNVVSA